MFFSAELLSAIYFFLWNQNFNRLLMCEQRRCKNKFMISFCLTKKIKTFFFSGKMYYLYLSEGFFTLKKNKNFMFFLRQLLFLLYFSIILYVFFWYFVTIFILIHYFLILKLFFTQLSYSIAYSIIYSINCICMLNN